MRLRSNAYLAAGKQGLVILDAENPEALRVDQISNGEGEIGDTYSVKVAATNASLFA